ncbi:hypothetical protein DITRI_Ditri05aG0064200 [Diplodiscus trichospermus]
MASSSADLVIGQLISLLQAEASSLRRVPDEIKEMNLLLASMRSFLLDADHRARPTSQRQKEWVKNVRDLAYEVEDTIDEFTYHETKRRQWRVANCKTFFLRSLHFPKDWYLRHQVAAKLQDINKRMKSMTERANQFGVKQLEVRDTSPYDPNWKNRLSESSLFFKDNDLVGIKKAQDELLGQLMAEELRRTVISVVGIGGSGKTTLVANTFNKQSVKQHFDFCTWITVSQQYAIEELFRSMVKDVYKQRKEEVPLQVDTMSYRSLVEKLVQYLQSRRYLVVFDDVWNIEFWQEINIVLPEGMHGSRVIVTTRKEDVALSPYGVVSCIHQIQPLKKDDAWKLFCRRAFANNLDGCPPYLDSLAWSLVEKCEGLPLAIVALGGLMSSKKSTAEWKIVHDNLNWELSSNPALESVKIISLLSYHDLSFQLKHCFLYCCLFPEDYEISRKRLIRLWMAEGFLEHVKDVTPEAVAEKYLMELISRGLLQVKKRNSFGRPKTIKMHDILREFALSISKEEKFLAVSGGKKGVEENGIRRYSIEVRDKEMNPGGKGMSQLRTLFVFVVDEISKSSFNKLPSGLKLLRVLDLENAPISELPKGFGHLFNLRYLNLRNTQVKVLPKSIGQLFNLQTLLLNGAKIVELPYEIVKLQNLRHLSAFYNVYESQYFKRYDSVRVPPSICRIKSLQVLALVEATDALIAQLKEMTQLKSLGLDNAREACEKELCSSIGKMEHLHRLDLSGDSGKIKMDRLSSAPPYLEKLFLKGKLENVPHWFKGLHNLTHLTLQGSELGEDLLSHIQALPNLAFLVLQDNAYNQERLCFLAGFEKLRRLGIRNCPSLNEIVIEKDVMPGLEFLRLYNCKELRGFLSYGLNHLNHLKQVFLYDVSEELLEHFCRETNIVGHSPTRGMFLDRADDDDDDDDAKHKWFYKPLD